jgi:hypothetical protein
MHGVKTVKYFTPVSMSQNRHKIIRGEKRVEKHKKRG